MPAPEPLKKSHRNPRRIRYLERRVNKPDGKDEEEAGEESQGGRGDVESRQAKIFLQKRSRLNVDLAAENQNSGKFVLRIG